MSRGHVIAVANLKGGVGKSTLSVNLACSLTELGARVALVDNDEQGSAAAWAAGGKLPVTCVHLPLGRLDEIASWLNALDRLRQRHDLVLVDAPASIAPALAVILLMSTLVLIPTSFSELEIAATRRMLRHVRQARAERPDDPPAVLLVPNRVTDQSPSVRDLGESLAELEPEMTPLVRYRPEYQHAFARRLWIGELQPRSAAHREMLALARFVRARLAARSPSTSPAAVTGHDMREGAAPGVAFVRSDSARTAALRAIADQADGPSAPGVEDAVPAPEKSYPAADPVEKVQVIYLDEVTERRPPRGRALSLLMRLTSRLIGRGQTNER